MKIQTRSITLAATMVALCLVTYMIPGVFFIPVTVAATTLSFWLAAFVGLAFGAVSVMYSFLFPTGLAAAGFVQAPYIALLPRILAALGAFGMYKLLMHCVKPQKRIARAAVVSAAAATASLLNTALVVGMFVLVMPGVYGTAAAVELIISGAIELACMAVLTPPVTLTLEKTVLRDRKRDALAAKNTGEVAAVAGDGAATGEQSADAASSELRMDVAARANKASKDGTSV